MSSVAAPMSLEKAPIVLVADDKPATCMRASDHRRDSGYRTLEAHNARQAIDLLEKDVDVVFSDVRMPEGGI